MVAGVSPPSVTAASATLIDAQTGTVLYAKEADASRFPASTTKIMTALLLLESGSLEDVVVAPQDVEAVTDSSLHLRPGEQVTVGELLYAILLRSANDASYAAAIHVAGSVEAFAERMNRRAKDLGCTGTHFRNPHGLHDPEHQTTAHDLALIAREAMRRPEFQEVVRTRKHQIVRSINQQDLWLKNGNALLAIDPTIDGVKTGFTNPAGRCFVGSATRDGYRLIAVVLKSADWRADAMRLLDWGFGSFRRVSIARSGESLGAREVRGGERASVPFGADRDVCAFLAKNQDPSVSYRFEWRGDLEAPVGSRSKLGVATVLHDGRPLGTFDVVALDEVPRKSLLVRAGSGGNGVALAALALIGATYWFRRKARPW